MNYERLHSKYVDECNNWAGLGLSRFSRVSIVSAKRVDVTPASKPKSTLEVTGLFLHSELEEINPL